MVQRVTRITPLLLILMVVGCKKASSAGEEATPTPYPTPIVQINPTYQVQRGEVVKTFEFTGRIAPVSEQELFFRTSGYVATVYVDRDDDVKAGDLLVELETVDLQNQLAQAKAEAEAIQLSNERQVAEAQAALHTAELRLEQAKVNDPSPQVTIAKVALERAQIALADAQDEHQKALDRPWEPDEVREATARVVYQAELSLEVAQAQYAQALQARDSHGYDIQLLEQEVELARKRVEELAVGADLKRAELNVKRLNDLLADARVVAPFDGRILSLSVSAGRQVEAYKPVIVLAEMSELEVSATLDGKEMEELAEGMPVTLMVNNRPGEEYRGHIRVLPYPYGGGGRSTDVEDRDTSTRVALEVEPTEIGLEIGDSMRITVVLERKQDALWLPPQAIRTFEGRKFVVVQEGDAQLRVDVRVGVEGEDRVEIEEGLTEGQVVIGQ